MSGKREVEEPKDNYAGFAPCGCMLIVISGQCSKKEIAKTVSEMIRKGLRVEPVTTSFVRGGHPMGCEQCVPKRFARQRARSAQTVAL